MTGALTRPSSTAADPPKFRLGRYQDLALVPAIVVLFVVGALVSPVFATTGNLVAVLQQQSELSLLVLGQALILIAGKMDLSLESTIGIAPALAIALVIPAASNGLGVELPAWTAIPVCLLVGAAVGGLNGFLVLKLGLSGFMVTLGMLTMLRGLQEALTKGQTLFDVPESFLYLGATTWLGLPAAVWVCVLLFAAGIFALTYLRQGRSLYAVGGNREAARAAGIRVDRVVWAVLVIGGLLAAVAGILMTGRLGTVAVTQGSGMIFKVFAAAVIGGISLQGGRGTLFGALSGVLMLGLVENILRLLSVSGFYINASYGAVIILALVVTRFATGKVQE
ncbi:ABC transporter permease [Saccharothrix sp. NPDC042600]|uniref:ABC transporter permease n=1 Tax=Saccharothrix TaxID=2071 RepID=UPI0033D2B6BC|nr:ABC transporter permease [Saccharothrix mutabilis subsp. capreolus]